MSGPHVLFVCHDAGGTIPPVIAVARALMALGARVSVLSQPSVRWRAEQAGCQFSTFSRLGDYDRGEPIESQLSLSVPALTGADVGDDLIRTLQQEQAELVVVDPNLTGALAAAESLDRPSVVLLHSIHQTFVDSWFGELWQFLADPINATRAQFGVAPASSWASLFDNHDLIISPVPAFFDGPGVERPPPMRSYGFLVPPSSAEHVDFPSGPGATVLVSLSTTQQNQRGLLVDIIEALAGLPVRALVTTAGHAAAQALPAPPNVTVTDFADHPSALAEAAAMVTHAGLGSVAAALDAGVPLVCTPIGRDQPLNARRVAELGAGVVVGRPTSEDIARAVTLTITTPSYREAARSIATAAAREGGPGRAAADILGLLR